MQVTVSRHIDFPDFTVTYKNPDPQGFSWRPMIWGIVQVRLINHRTDRKERIIGAQVALKRRHWWLWRKTIAVAPGRYRGGAKHRQPVSDIELEPQSAPVEFELEFEQSFEDDPPYTKKMDLVLELDTVGPLRIVRRKIGQITHSPAGS